jgi:signal transduction histidine kinase/ActR/RegA family two-component response regulator
VAQLEQALSEGVDPIQRSLSEHAASFLNVVTPEGRFLATGRPSEGFGSVIGRSVFEFLEAESVPVLRETLAQVVATGRPAACETIGFGEDGSPGHTYLTRIVPLKTGDAVTALVIVPTDITERVRLQRSLVEGKQALRLAIRASRMGLWRWDVATGQITWDDRLRELWGVTEAPANYADYVALIHPEDRSLVETMVRSALETGVYRTFEHRLAAREGFPERWILAAGSVEMDASGKPVRLMGGALDITEQKQVAARVNRAERVESIGQFTAGIAHNFNNLLAAILPNLEFCLASATAGPQRERLSIALDATLRARDLVRSLISLTQRDGTSPPSLADPRDVITRMVALCRLTFPRELTLSQKIAADVRHVSMPARDLEQVLLNLLFNARDALEAAAGPRAIDIIADLVPNGAGQARARIRVKDTGVGMSEEVRARVFEPFFTTKPPHKGSGLGLANAAARVRDAGGEISCDSTAGTGSTFTLFLPLQVPDAAQSRTEPRPTESAGGARILLVDDEPFVRKIVRQILERDGCTVFEGSSAAEAREILERESSRVDLIILDQSMPHESGVEALPSLRRLTNAPIVLFTGLAPDLPPGVDAVLEKPARPAEIQTLVRDVLKKHGRTAPSAAD